MPNPIQRYKKDNIPLIFAHRGLVTEHQENTLDAVMAAVQNDACDGTEIDVFLTKDNQLVLFHDEDLKRLVGDERYISEMTWTELQTLQIKQSIDTEGGLIHYPKPQPIPLLEDVLEQIKGTEFILEIELKANAIKWSRRKIGAAVAKLIKKMEMESQVFCVSFDFFMLQSLENEHRSIYTGFGYDDDMPLPKNWVQWLMEQNTVGQLIHSDCTIVEHNLIDDNSIKKYQQRGMGIGSYTLFPLCTAAEASALDAYHRDEVKRLTALGVDWITSDNPEKVYDVVQGAIG